MVVGVYSERFGEYADEQFIVTSSLYNGKKDSVVSSYILNKSGSKIDVDWRVRLKNNKYRVVDVVVAGVSMAVTQRAEFAAIIDRGGGKVDSLLAHLSPQ